MESCSCMEGSAIHKILDTSTGEAKQQDHHFEDDCVKKKQKKTHVHFCVSAANAELLH